jgi:hypothetical protein
MQIVDKLMSILFSWQCTGSARAFVLHELCRKQANFAAFFQTAQDFSAFVSGSQFPTTFSFFSFPQEKVGYYAQTHLFFMNLCSFPSTFH